MRTVVHKATERQSRALWLVLARALPKAALTRITGTYTYGLNPRVSGCVAEYDGIMAVHAILSVYKKDGIAHRNDLRNTIYSSPHRFSLEAPNKVTQSLRRTLHDANTHCVTLEWEMFGAKVVAILAERTAVFAQNLAKYGPTGAAYLALPNKADSADLIDQLFNDIDTSAAQWEAANPGQNANAIWRANAVEITDPAIRAQFHNKILGGKGKGKGKGKS